MVKSTSLFLLLLLLGLGKQSSLYGGENPFAVKFPMKEGIIHYAIRGSVQGTKLLYFTDYGKTRLIVEKTRGNILSHPGAEEKAVLIQNGVKYTIDLEKKRIHKEPLFNTLLKEKFTKLTPKEQQKILKNLKNFPDRSWQNLNHSCTTRAKKVADFWCTAEQIEGKIECSVAHGALVVDSSVDILGFHVKEFVTQVEHKAPPTDIFQLPKNMPVIQSDKDLSKDADAVLSKLIQPDCSFSCQPRRVTTADKEELHRLMYKEIQNLSKNF